MLKMQLSKRLGRLVQQGAVLQSIRSDWWNRVSVGDQVAVWVGLDTRWQRRMCVVTVTKKDAFSAVDDVVTVDGVPVADVDALAFAQGYGDWIQLKHQLYEHSRQGFDDSYNGVLVTFTV